MTLSDFFAENSKIALAFSGGTDSSYLLYAATMNHADICAYYVKTPFQPQFELDDAKRLAAQLNAKMKIVAVDVLDDDTITSNPSNRCYFCKKRIFSAILKAVTDDQNASQCVIIDGTNASDQVSDRPGMKALRELEVRSPLRECGITKMEVRRLSKEAGLFTWDKPSYACLATRIPTDEQITAEKLKITEKSEDYLSSLGFKDFWIRMRGGMAVVQTHASQNSELDMHRQEIIDFLAKHYKEIHFEPGARDE